MASTTSMYNSETYNDLIKNFWTLYKEQEFSDSNKEIEKASKILEILNDCGLMLTCAKYDYLKYVMEGLEANVKHIGSSSSDEDSISNESSSTYEETATSSDETYEGEDEDETTSETCSSSSTEEDDDKSSESSCSEETEEEDTMDPEIVSYSELANCFLQKAKNTLFYLIMGEY